MIASAKIQLSLRNILHLDILPHIVHNADKKASDVIPPLILPACFLLTELNTPFSVETLAVEILHSASFPTFTITLYKILPYSNLKGRDSSLALGRLPNES